MKNTIKKLLFFWTTSVSTAIPSYYLLWAIMPNHYVFGIWYRMFLYHWEHPIQYILIPCFFYGIIATYFSTSFVKKEIIGQLFLTSIIILATIVISSPFGGMLWHYHDMQAGYFPKNWIKEIITEGTEMGLEMGLIIIALSIPYNVLGSIVCYFLTKKGSELL
jgi:hypothetical protein